jgi:hypothetical protein
MLTPIGARGTMNYVIIKSEISHGVGIHTTRNLPLVLVLIPLRADFEQNQNGGPGAREE